MTLVDGPGQIEVQLGDPPRVVGDQGQRHPVVADVDVGMVIGLFGQLPDRVDEGQARRSRHSATTLTSLPADQFPRGPSAGQCASTSLLRTGCSSAHSFALRARPLAPARAVSVLVRPGATPRLPPEPIGVNTTGIVS